MKPNLLRFLLFSLIVFPLTLPAQIAVTQDTVYVCAEPATLYSVPVIHSSSESYEIESNIPYLPLQNTADSVFTKKGDNEIYEVPLKFDFCFFSNTFSSIYISVNGWMSFEKPTALQAGQSPIALPSIISSVPKNLIALWDDWFPARGGEVSYFFTGVFPFRKLIVSWDSVTHFSNSCDSIKYNGQIILHETTNIIEFFTNEKGVCAAWNSGIGTHGIQNGSGTIAYTFPNRNAQAFTIINEGNRIKPNGVIKNYEIKWYENGNIIGNSDSVTVNPQNTQEYIVEITYLCTGAKFTDTVIVKRDDTIINGITKNDVTCFGNNNGNAAISVLGTGPFTYSWNSDPIQNTPAASNLKPGNYIVTVSTPNCTYTRTVTINEPSLLTADLITEDAHCGLPNGTASVNPSGGNGGYIYSWSNGFSGNSINALDDGNYEVTITDQEGCTITKTFNLIKTGEPQASFEIFPSAKSISGISVGFNTTSSSPTNIVNYSWDFGDNSLSDGQTVAHAYSSSGLYNIIHTIEDEFGCIDTAIKSVEVISGIIIPNVITPDGDNINDYFKIGHLEFFSAMGLQIFNRWGQLLYETNFYQNEWNGDGLPEGTYFYIITMGHQKFKGHVSLFRKQ